MESAFDYLPKEIDAVPVISNQFYYVEDVNVSVGGSFGGFSTAGLHGQRLQSRLNVHMMGRDGESILHQTFLGESEEKIFSNEDDTCTLKTRVSGKEQKPSGSWAARPKLISSKPQGKEAKDRDIW